MNMSFKDMFTGLSLFIKCLRLIRGSAFLAFIPIFMTFALRNMFSVAHLLNEITELSNSFNQEFSLEDNKNRESALANSWVFSKIRVRTRLMVKFSVPFLAGVRIRPSVEYFFKRVE